MNERYAKLKQEFKNKAEAWNIMRSKSEIDGAILEKLRSMPGFDDNYNGHEEHKKRGSGQIS